MEPGVVWLLGFLGVAAGVWLLFGRGASNEEVMQALEAGVPVVDVRTPGEFATGHVKGAQNLPVDALASRVAELGPPGKVLIYCRSGMRSARAATILRSAGFDVIDAKRVTAFPAEWLES